MRVIAGSARSLPLKTIEGLNTRPTTDRIKETLFNILQPNLPGCLFLDLFSGSGAIGIEALSRGAKTAWFVENNKMALKCIHENLRFTHLDDKAVVMDSDVVNAIHRLNDRDLVFDYIFMDPPYQGRFEQPVLSALSDSKLVGEETVIICEAALDTDFSFLEESGLTLIREKRYKTNRHMMIGRAEVK
ncbi:MAG: 16S rRNA (guanine(966)-N(2))-methyltransferase RsmD [Lachnospiraceae bacterium]